MGRHPRELGHAQVSLPANLYTHLSPANNMDAAEALGMALYLGGETATA